MQAEAVMEEEVGVLVLAPQELLLEAGPTDMVLTLQTFDEGRYLSTYHTWIRVLSQGVIHILRLLCFLLLCISLRRGMGRRIKSARAAPQTTVRSSVVRDG